MHTTFQRRWSIAVLVPIIIAVPLFISLLKRRQSRRRRYLSGRALIRYIQMHNQYSEEAAYQRLAAFVIRHIPLDEQSTVYDSLAHNRRRLLELAQRILQNNPDEIDAI